MLDAPALLPWLLWFRLGVALAYLTNGNAFVGIHRYNSRSWQLWSTNGDSDSSLSTALRSVTFANIPKDQEPDVLCDFLMELGACSTSITDAEAGTPNETPLFSEPSASFVRSDAAWSDSLHWAAPLWNTCNVTAHFSASIDLQNAMDLILECFPHYPIPSNVGTVPDRDWVIHVQSTWNPIVVANKFLLRFPWHSDEHVEKAVQQIRGDSHQLHTTDSSFIELLLQGGIAFGTGEHATTQLCLEWLNEIVPQIIAQEHDSRANSPILCLDYGAGSGVLGMAACRLNPKIQSVGIDIDLDACRIANENARQNKVNMRTYLPSVNAAADNDSKALLLKAQQHARSQLTHHNEENNEHSSSPGWFMSEETAKQQVDVCVANILAGPLVALAPTLALAVKPGGYLGLSGILRPLGDQVAAAYTKAGFEHVEIAKEKDGWVLVTGRKRRRQAT